MTPVQMSSLEDYWMSQMTFGGEIFFNDRVDARACHPKIEVECNARDYLGGNQVPGTECHPQNLNRMI